jgi:hypothetical protein
MTGFRGSDEALDREISAVERIARLRVRRAAAELKDLERDLRFLKRERARRRAESAIEATVSEESPATAHV